LSSSEGGRRLLSHGPSYGDDFHRAPRLCNTNKDPPPNIELIGVFNHVQVPNLEMPDYPVTEGSSLEVTKLRGSRPLLVRYMLLDNT
jgi:hypothetical protein